MAEQQGIRLYIRKNPPKRIGSAIVSFFPNGDVSMNCLSTICGDTPAICMEILQGSVKKHGSAVSVYVKQPDGNELWLINVNQEHVIAITDLDGTDVQPQQCGHRFSPAINIC